VLRATPYIRECVENKDKTKLIRDAISQGTSQYGMQTFDQSLYQLYNTGKITREEALLRATNKDELRLRMEGIHSTADAARVEMQDSMQDSGSTAADEGMPGVVRLGDVS
ncbi:MAG: type IV pili twitching motility protein PilT, partial [Acidobacteriota bacterium]|nr:type IV pili twitching motility protein PilT [Acidobacteriota bacterium]